MTTQPFAPPCDIVFVDGGFVAADEAAVSVHANALSYGTGTFEGIRACWNAEHEQLYLLEALDHFRRLARSARILGLALPFTPERLVTASVELLRRNDVRADAYLRPLLIQSGAVLPVRMHDVPTRLSIAATPMPGDYIDPRGVRCMVSTWRRAPDVAAANRAKVTGGYPGPALAKTEAARRGYDEAIMLTLDGFVAEATTSNVLVRIGDGWVTPPGTDDILEGITRRQVMKLIEELTGRTVVERRVQRTELYTADEVLLCGTAAGVVPVVEIDERLVGSGRPGELTGRLAALLRAIASRTDDRHPEWTVPVHATERQMQ
ncbi:branched-chain-amino-acid transaminase [Pseudonocardia sp. TRM90224]|uniref:branched-chain-amino-acid transaminase n=1 Tax=Pseudonocardia sp. TRM90224 TaxID=2812678 RepID=UPI001E301103|nr:branched-chain-amino-acid transaminase [Pseudonocardia sp. TRM90224]